MVAPIVEKLVDKFRITVVLFNYSSPPDLIERLDKLKADGHIESYFITPEFNKMIGFHLFWRAKIKELGPCEFDCLLSAGEAQVGERYLLDCVLSKNCVVVCMWFNVTHLFINTQGKPNGKSPAIDLKNYELVREDKGSRIITVFLKFIYILRNGEFLRKARLASQLLPLILVKKIRYFFDRFFLPMLMAGRVFRMDPLDALTEFSSGRADALIFFEESDAEAHRKLLKGQKVYVAESPNIGNCRCDQISSREKVVLSPMSGFMGQNNIDEKWMYLFYRDYQIVLSQTGAKKLHLRLHPDETGAWSYRLQEYLVGRGIDASLVGCEKPIREIMCDYIGLAGFSSSSFRDARASCDYAFVVGFTAVSNYIFNDPKYNYGSSTGIEWIEKDGSFDPDIFVRKKHTPPARKSVPEILVDLSDSGKK